MAQPMTAAEMRAAMKKWGVQYREYPGWSTRTRPGAFVDMRGLIIHHTGSDSQSDDYLKWIFTQGRAAEGIPAPLCHVSTDMDGDVWIGAIGRANHAGKGSSGVLGHVTAEDYAGYVTELKAGPDDTDGNAHFYGNEVRYDGGQPMTAKQYASAVRWAAAICDHYGWTALSVIGHREWSSRKPDPGNCPMNKFRAAVAALLKAGPPQKSAPAPTPTTPTGALMATLDSIQTAVNGLRTEESARYVTYSNRNTDLVNRLGAVNDRLDAIDTALADVKNRLIRIEDDTDGTVTP